MTTKILVCVACNTEKDIKNYRRNQKVCIECEKNGASYSKICVECNEEKDNKLFYANRSKCKECCNAPNRITDTISSECSACKETKLRKEFRRGQNVCKYCESNTVKYTKKCRDCQVEKSGENFRNNRPECIDCERAYGRNYNKSTDTRKKWVENNRERMSQLQHEFYEKNKVVIREKQSENYNNDPHIKMIRSYRDSVRNLIRGQNTKCAKVGMTHDQYCAWLQFCFTGEMNHDNYVEVWQVDHILPLNVLKTKEVGEFTFNDERGMKYIYAWYNTTPCLCKDNMKKNKHLADSKTLAAHLNNVKSFLVKYKKSLGIKVTESYLIYKVTLQYIVDNM